MVNRTYLKWLIIMGLIEGFSTLLLFFVAMPMKYYWDMPMAVTVVGGVHGFLFVALIVMFLLARTMVPIKASLMWWGMLGAVIPFGPFIVDVYLYRIFKSSDQGQGSP